MDNYLSKLNIDAVSGFDDHLVHRLTADTLWMVIARFVWIMSSSTIGILVARMLDPTNLGILNYVTSYVGIFSIPATLGIGNIVIRAIILKPENRNHILSNYFTFRCTVISLFIGTTFPLLTSTKGRQDLKFIFHSIFHLSSSYFLVLISIFFAKI